MKTMNWIKRVLALATASSLVLGMLTTGVFALEGDIDALVNGVGYEHLADAVEAAGKMEGTATITLLRDVTLTSSLELKNDAVLDLGGRYTLTLSGAAGFWIGGYRQQVTIRNGQLAGRTSAFVTLTHGSLVMEDLRSAPDAWLTLNLNGGSAIISGCTLSSIDVMPLLMIQGADVTVNGGSDLSLTGMNAMGVAYLNGGRLTVENATITGEAGLGINVSSGGEVTLNSGARVENLSTSSMANSVRVSGGTVTVNEGARVFSAGFAIDRQGDDTINLNGGIFRNVYVHEGASFDENDFDINGNEYTYKGSSQAHTHAWTDWAEVRKATCTEEGLLIHTCMSCNETETSAYGPISHVWGAWTDDEPVCVGELHQTSICPECKGEQHRTIEAPGHNWTIWTVTQLPSCTEKGVRSRTCRTCGEAETQEVEMIPHSWNNGEVTTEPTETEEGVRTFTCTVCEATRTEAIPVLGHEHNWAESWTSDETGHWYACSGCNEQHDKADHTFGDWSVDREPTCTVAGSQSRECSVCGFVETEEIPATGDHRYVEGWAFDAANHWHACSDCGAHSGDAPHTENSGVVTTPATATTAGVRTYSCSVCGRELRTATIPATGSGNQGGNGGYIPSIPSIPSVPSGPSTPAGPTGSEDLDDPDTPLAEEPGEEPGEEDLDAGNTPLISRPFLFTDVGDNKWYYSAIKYVFDRELMNGVTDTRFDPSISTSRGMLVTVLYRLDGAADRDEVLSAPMSFSDVPAGKWYTDSVLWASDKGVVNGYDLNTFGPNDNVTRQQVAAILYRYAQYRGCDVSARADLSGYADAARVSGYAKDPMSWAVGTGIIGGIDAVTLDPKGNASRAQIATMLMRFDQFLADSTEQGEEEAVG